MYEVSRFIEVAVSEIQKSMRSLIVFFWSLVLASVRALPRLHVIVLGHEDRVNAWLTENLHPCSLKITEVEPTVDMASLRWERGATPVLLSLEPYDVPSDFTATHFYVDSTKNLDDQLRQLYSLFRRPRRLQATRESRSPFVAASVSAAGISTAVVSAGFYFLMKRQPVSQPVELPPPSSRSLDNNEVFEEIDTKFFD